ncbi:hypothetical protein AY599_00415 [Leptolyngbya valderiana BDU 20041]|nr:hypothetical protein [Geitlerinema sp. CS-897]OAB63037.1 hypothetical protein AY599_00415 [Leptolyngbya valderiana BDU 20041]PPT08663.1 Type II secretory pathway ATPase PulE/Tfp pilus assembly pathway ATPase PilB [Geitlerinema sp. FC II]
MNSDWIFNSIDKLIPFEVCLYHQVVPLSMEGSRIYLGMVDPDDTAALEYLRQLLSYLNCSIVPRSMAAREHQAILSAYLNHTTDSTPDTSTVQRDSKSVTEEEAPEVPTIQIKARYLASPVSVLATLAPAQIVPELLARVLMGGIGRLHFARQAESGRILWSQDGVPQSVLDRLPLEIFQSIINELKRFADLPLLPVRQQKEVELERLYNSTRVLLKLRVMRGDYGEEATLQVLRGAALKFYNQQKLIDLSQEVLLTAQTLQKKLEEIRNAYERNPNLSHKTLEVLPALTQVLERVEAEMATLRDRT